MVRAVIFVILLLVIWIEGYCVKKTFSQDLCTRCSKCSCRECPNCHKKITCNKCSVTQSPTHKPNCDCPRCFKYTSSGTYYPIYKPTTYGMRY